MLPALAVVLKSLAANGLTALAGAVASKGIEAVEEATGIKIPLKAEEYTKEKCLELKQAEFDNEEKLRQFTLESMRIEKQDEQASHHETQETIRAGDKAEDPFVRRTRPGQSWVSLFAALAYAFHTDIDTDFELYTLGLLLTLPWAYAGLREVGKGIMAWKETKIK